MKRSVALMVVGVAALALVAAGCGGSSTHAATTPGGVSVAGTAVGKALVGPNGRTLYLFEKDRGAKSACTGGCAAEWPPLTTTGTPRAGSGVDAAKLSVTKRAGGKSQVVYGGHPLYYYTGDTKASDANGQGINAFGAKWFAVSATGAKVATGGGGSVQGGYRY